MPASVSRRAVTQASVRRAEMPASLAAFPAATAEFAEPIAAPTIATCRGKPATRRGWSRPRSPRSCARSRSTSSSTAIATARSPTTAPRSRSRRRTGCTACSTRAGSRSCPDIGPSIARVVGDLARRGSSSVLEKLRAKWPSVIVELAQLPYVGVHEGAQAPRGARARRSRCGRRRCAGRRACASCRASARSASRRSSPRSRSGALRGTRAIHVDAEEHAQSLARLSAREPAATRVEIAGPVRRWFEIVDHLAFAVATDAPRRDHRSARELRARHLGRSRRRRERGRRRSSPTACAASSTSRRRARFGWALIRATGSPEHVELLRARAASRGIDLDDARRARRGRRLSRARSAVHAARGARRHRRAAAADAGDDFSDLVTLADVTTAFHCHTTYSDGKDSIEAMARAAAELGMQAITITDHSAAASYAGGLDADEPARPGRRDRRRCAICRCGSCAAPRPTSSPTARSTCRRELVGELDLVIASVHQRYKLDEDAMTKRLVTAMRQPFFKIWGHALGRLVLRRDPIAVRHRRDPRRDRRVARRDRDQRRSVSARSRSRSTRARPPLAGSRSCCRATRTRCAASGRCGGPSRWRGVRGSASARS